MEKKIYFNKKLLGGLQPPLPPPIVTALCIDVLNNIYTHRDNRTRELAMSRDRGPLCKFKMVA